MHKRQVMLLSALILIVLSVRLAIFGIVYTTGQPHIQTADSPAYIESAKSILELGRFTSAPDKLDQPEVIRTPGYPLLIALVFALLGKNLTWVIIAQILISGFTILLTYQLAFQLTHSGWAAFLASLALALDIHSFLSSQMIMAETLFTPLVVGIVLFGLAWIRSLGTKRAYGYAFLTGLCIAVATLVRPVAYYLIFLILAGWLVWAGLRRYALKSTLLTAGCLSLAWIILVGGWQVRNQWLTGCPDLSRIEGINLLYFRGAGIIAARDHVPFFEAQSDLKKEYPMALESGIGGCGPAKTQAIQLIGRYPLLFLKVEGEGWVNLTFESGAGDLIVYYLRQYYPHSPLQDLGKLSATAFIQRWVVDHPLSFSIYVYGGMYLVGIYGLIGFYFGQMLRLRNQKLDVGLWFLFGIVFYFVLISMGPEAYARFRVPIMPFLCIFASLGAVGLGNFFLSQGKTKQD